MVSARPTSAVLLVTLSCIARALAQDQDTTPTDGTESTTVAPTTPPQEGAPPVPTPSPLNPNHSYYPPAYRPPQGGYKPTNWNRYPPHQYRPGTAQSPNWYHRPAYRPPPTSTYDWWKGFQRSPSLDPSGSSSNYWPTSVVPPATGYRSNPPYYGSNGWQPYYIAVGYYRKSPTSPGYGTSYPSAGVGTGGYPSSYGRGYPYYGSGYTPYSSGYGYGGYYGTGGYPYTSTHSQGYPSASGAGQWYPSTPGYGGVSGSYPPYYGSGYTGSPATYPSYPYHAGVSGSYPPYYGSGYPGSPATYPSYPSHGGGYTGYPSYGSSYPNYYAGSYYGSGQSSSYPSYPYYGGSSYGSGYASSYPSYPYYGGSTYSYPYSGGYSTGKYTGSGSYPYGGQGGASYPNQNNRYYSPWYCCTYYPGYNKGYSTSGSDGVKQNVGSSGSVQKTGAQQTPKRSYVRRALRDQPRDQQDAEPRIEDSSSETLSGIQRYIEDHKPSMFKAVSELSNKKLPRTSLMAYHYVLDEAVSGDENGILRGSDQGITGEMVESYQRRLLALNRMFDTLISPSAKPEESYFQKRVRAYNKLLSMTKQHRGLQGEADGKQQGLQVKLGQLMTLLKGYVFRHDATGEQARRTVEAVYNAFHEPDLTNEDMLKVLSIAENLIAEISAPGSEKAEKAGDASSDSISSSSSSSEESKEPATTTDSKQLYDRLEKLGGLYRYVMPGLLTLEKQDDDSNDRGSKEASDDKDSADVQLRGSLSVKIDLQGKSNFGKNTIDNVLKAVLA